MFGDIPDDKQALKETRVKKERLAPQDPREARVPKEVQGALVIQVGDMHTQLVLGNSQVFALNRPAQTFQVEVVPDLRRSLD